MIVKRYNFETNSSSMHSLSYRNTEGDYTQEELMKSEALEGTKFGDAIIVMKQDNIVLDVINVDSDLWVFENTLRISSYNMDFYHSPMEILATFKSKLRYLLATINSTQKDGWAKLYEDITNTVNKVLPGVTLQLNNSLDYDNENNLNFDGETESDLLIDFLTEYNMSVEDFLLNKKYIVIVNYAEYKKMKNLGMVDEAAIDFIYHQCEETECLMSIDKDGVWHLSDADISFGRSPFRVLGTPEGKARYALAASCSQNMDEVISILREVYPNLKKIELPKSDYEDVEYETGYCDDCAIPSNISLRDFILDKKYVIIADGDEYCVWDDFKKTQLFNKAEYEKK